MLKAAAVLLGLTVGATLLIVTTYSGVSAATQSERFTDYQTPTGPEMSVASAQADAVAFARREHQSDALTLTSVHATFAQAHALLMGEDGAAAVVAESGTGERSEEMRASVWVTMLQAASGSTFEPNNPHPRNHKAPSGKVMIVVADAHTGFIKEEYLGPSAPQIATLWPTIVTSVPRESSGATSARLNPHVGAIVGRLSPARAHQLVSVIDSHHRRVMSTRSLARSRETVAGAFSFRIAEGRYLVTSAGCKSQIVPVAGRSTSHVLLRCRQA